MVELDKKKWGAEGASNTGRIAEPLDCERACGSFRYIYNFVLYNCIVFQQN